MATYSDLIRLPRDLSTLVMWPNDAVLHTRDGSPGIIFGAIIMILLPHYLLLICIVIGVRVAQLEEA